MSRTIKIHKKERCSTADYWAALLGFKEFFTIDSKASNVPQVMAHLALKENELDPQPCRVFNLENNLIAVNLLNNDRIIDNFPMLENGFILRTETEAIYEWNETEELAAQIRAKGLGKYALEYFASDYSYRKEQYQKRKGFNSKSICVYLSDHYYRRNPQCFGKFYSISSALGVRGKIFVSVYCRSYGHIHHPTLVSTDRWVHPHSQTLRSAGRGRLSCNKMFST